MTMSVIQSSSAFSMRGYASLDVARAQEAQRPEAVERSDVCAHEDTCRAPQAEAVQAESGGSIFRAVIRTFVQFATAGSSEAKETHDDPTVVTARQKLKLEIEVEEDGDVQIDFMMKSKIKVRGDAPAAGDLMQAMQAFTASLFAAMNELVGKLLAPKAATPIENDAASLPIEKQPPAPLPAPVGSGNIPATAPSAVEEVVPQIVEAAAPTPAPLVPMQTKPVSEAPTSQVSKLKLHAAYLSFDYRLRVLADWIDKESETGTATTPATLDELRANYALVSNALGAPRGIAPSLPQFLQALAGNVESSQHTRFDFAYRMTGRFVSVAA